MEQTGIPYDLILQNLPEAVIIADKKLSITNMNPAAEALTGWTQKTAAGKDLTQVLRLIDHEKRQEVKIPSVHTFQHDKKPVSYKHVLLLSSENGETPVDVLFTAMVSHRGIYGGYLAILTDITGCLKVNEEYVNRQKIDAISNMANYLAHDFSDSLGAISGHASAIADNLIPKTRAHEEALRILQATKRAGILAKHLMSIARLSNTKTDMKVEAVSLGNVAKEAVRIMEESFFSQTTSFKVRNPEGMPYVMADERQLLDCLINLLINSIDAMPNGGTVTIDSSEKIYKKNSFAVLRLRDSGVGMTQEVLMRAFDPFFTTKPAGSGSGLGLTVTRSSVERWGGFINIRSQPNQGTSIRLFMRKAKVQPARTIARAAKAKLETILIIDDSRSLLDRNAAILKHADYQVYSTTAATEGVELYIKHADEIDLTVIDLVMPGTDGKKVLEQILEFDPTASIIMTSGFSRDYVRKTLERGAWGFIQKPFDADHLLTAVRKALDQNNIVQAETFTS